NEAIGSAAALYLILGGIAFLVGTGLYLFFTQYNIPPTLSTDAHWAFALMVLCVSLGFIGLLPEGVLAAENAFVPRNIVRLCSVLLRLILTVGLLLLHASLTA